jgi:hypothetical protein
MKSSNKRRSKEFEEHPLKVTENSRYPIAKLAILY